VDCDTQEWLMDRKNRRSIPHRLERCDTRQSATIWQRTGCGRSRIAAPSFTSGNRFPVRED
jgi:hypothetical protein